MAEDASGTPHGESSASARRRRRRRAAAPQRSTDAAPQGADAASAPVTAAPVTAATAQSSIAPASSQRPVKRRQRDPRDTAERGLRDLVGAGSSQVGVSGALRARDVNRPTADDLAEAERDTVIVRRHWQPPA